MVQEWWRNAVVYEIYLRSFADSDGDGVGDLRGVRDRLPYLVDLGVDAIWLTPFYPSPMRDHGYDVADYRGVDPRFGSLTDFDELLLEAHGHGLKVYVDIVPNHTSSEHPWFRAAVADPAAEERERYFFRPPQPDGSPPNDWQSVFGGSAWSPEPNGDDCYLHLFDPTQPDLNWRHGAVRAEFRSILRFWLDRGVDGFRIDVAHGLCKDRRLRDGTANAWDQDEVFDIWRQWRELTNGYGDRAFVGEVFLYDMDRVAQYVGRDRLHQAFNFVIAKMPYDADVMRKTVRRAIELFNRADTAPTWVLSNHDLVRHVTRFGGGETGRRRGLALTALLLGLPGSAYIYQGEELGLEESDVPVAARQDPMWLRTGERGRDGCRIPMPWTPDGPGHGFTSGTPWLPIDAATAARAVGPQDADPHSTLNAYRQMLRLRRELLPTLSATVSWPDTTEDAIVVHRATSDGGTLVLAMNAGRRPLLLPVPGDTELVLASAPGSTVRFGVAEIPADTTVWLLCVAGRTLRSH